MTNKALCAVGIPPQVTTTNKVILAMPTTHLTLSTTHRQPSSRLTLSTASRNINMGRRPRNITSTSTSSRAPLI